MTPLALTHRGTGAPTPVESPWGRAIPTRDDDTNVSLPSDGFCRDGQTVTAGEWAALHASRYQPAASYPSKDQTDDLVDTRESRRQERCPEEPAPLMSGPAVAAENAAAVHEGGAVRREGKGRGAPGAAPSRPEMTTTPVAGTTEAVCLPSSDSTQEQ